MDFTKLTTAADIEALQGPEREAWYAWRRGDGAKVAEIAEAYDLALAAEVESPEGHGRPSVETPETAPAKRPPGRPRKTTS